MDSGNSVQYSLFFGSCFGRLKLRRHRLDHRLHRSGDDDDAGRGLFYGNPRQLWIQFVSIIATAVFTAVGTLIIAYITKFVTGGLRVDEEEEIAGLDNSLHGERAFEVQG